jgi:hypothetical protein
MVVHTYNPSTEVEAVRPQIQGQPGQKGSKMLSEHQNRRARGVTQVVEHLPSKYRP